MYKTGDLVEGITPDVEMEYEKDKKRKKSKDARKLAEEPRKHKTIRRILEEIENE
jgi:C-terminal processing protease CtpA/Prc